MTFTPVSKNTTYLQIMDLVKMQMGSFKNPLISDSFLIKQIGISQQNIQAKTPDIHHYYNYTYTGLVITGSANPYKCDLSVINPYILKPELFIHVTAGGVRTHTQDEDANKAENYSSLPQYATTIMGCYRGDNLEIFKGSAFTMTPATDTITARFIRQTIGSTGVTPTVVSDASYSTSDGFIILGFSGTLVSHIGGTFVGIDSGGTPFSRNIVGYNTSSSFTIDSAIATGTGTNGYIIPSSTTNVTSASYIDLPDSMIQTLVSEVVAEVIKYAK
jgi:hypothetical protein